MRRIRERSGSPYRGCFGLFDSARGNFLRRNSNLRLDEDEKVGAGFAAAIAARLPCGTEMKETSITTMSTVSEGLPHGVRAHFARSE